jgi:predicted nicotinamide N-methyase
LISRHHDENDEAARFVSAPSWWDRALKGCTGESRQREDHPKAGR